MFRRGRERKEAQVRLPATLGHTAKQFLHVLCALFFCTICRVLAQRFASQDALQLCCGLAGLRTVRFIYDHRTSPRGQSTCTGLPTLLSHLEQVPRDEREFLQRGDDDWYCA